ncbi:MAG: hypothetical protein U0Z44_20650 [Kouleothrix sp.]
MRAAVWRTRHRTDGDDHHGNRWSNDYDEQSRYRQIVYLADHTWTPWTPVPTPGRPAAAGWAGGSRPGADPAGAGGARGRRAGARRTGCCCTRPARAASNTQAWFTPRGAQAHHHVRLGSSDDLARLVRRLTGRAIGVVLGGGARGTAHIGALRALGKTAAGRLYWRHQHWRADRRAVRQRAWPCRT